MIGSMEVEVKIVSRVGIRINTVVKVTHTMGANEVTIYQFQLTITSNLQKIWGITDERLNLKFNRS